MNDFLHKVYNYNDKINCPLCNNIVKNSAGKYAQCKTLDFSYIKTFVHLDVYKIDEITLKLRQSSDIFDIKISSNFTCFSVYKLDIKNNSLIKIIEGSIKQELSIDYIKEMYYTGDLSLRLKRLLVLS